MIDISSLCEKLIEQNKNPSIKNTDIISKNNFKFLYVIGKGGFGRVWKIQSKKSKEIFALKEMSKLKIIDKKSEKSINSEREFLSKLNHPFIVNMHYAFQDKDNLYLVMDMLSGGDLRYHISRYRKFSEEQTRFFISNIVYALQYIHENNVIHRDIKPENLVLDEKGYVRITDFGIAKENMPDNSSETSGTPGYMAPEVMKAKNHSFAVDFFAIGVIGYEFMLGRRPYYGKNRKEIKEQMLSKAAVINKDNIMKGWSNDSADFINLLLQRKEEKRLGYKEGAIELMQHQWLKYYPWKELKNKTLLAPFIPDKNDNFDKHYCESIDKISEETQLRYEEIYCSTEFKNVFKNFFFNGDDVKEIERKKKEEEKRKERELKEENEKIEKEKMDKEKAEKLLKEIEDNKEKIAKIEYIEKEISKSPSVNDRNMSYNFQKNLRSYNNENKVVTKKKEKNKTLVQDSLNNNKKNRLNHNNTSCSNNNLKNKNKKDDFSESSLNVSKKFFDRSNNKQIKNLKKPLSHSNSTREIYPSQSNIEKYLKKKVNQMQNSNSNGNNNNYHQAKPVIKHQKAKSKTNNNLIPPTSSKGSSASININNYFTNNIFNAIYNNYMPHQLFNKNLESKKKITKQRASSVLAPKRPCSKFNSNYKKNYEQNKKYKNNSKYKGYSNLPSRKMTRTNSSNKVKTKPSTEYLLNKIKSISVYDSHP